MGPSLPRPPLGAGRQMAAGHRRTALRTGRLQARAERLFCGLVINHICGSCFERQIRTDAVLRECFAAELVACFELRHLWTCSKTLLETETNSAFPCKESTHNTKAKPVPMVHMAYFTEKKARRAKGREIMNDKAVSSPSHHSSVGFHPTARAEEQQRTSPLTHTGHSTYLDLFR